MRILLVRKPTRLTPLQHGRGGRKYFSTPSGWAYLIISAYVLYFMTTADRPATLADQLTYVEYFRITTWQWVSEYFRDRTSALQLIGGLVTDELGWRAWIMLVNSFDVSPENGVRLTVVVINALVFYALSRLRRPLLGLLLWCVIPTGLAIAGLFQIRQGLAFAVAMIFAIVFQRPLLGVLIASSIHTTFAVPAILLIVARFGGPKNKVALPAVSIAGGLLAASGQLLFLKFGGRRIGDYSGYQAEFSSKLLILVVSYALASILVLSSVKFIQRARLQTSFRELALMHFGLIVYLVSAFFLFPFGKDRVFYYTTMLLPFFCQEIRVHNVGSLWMALVLYSMIAAEVVVAYGKGIYVYFLR